MKPVLSIVVPFYNVDLYFQECLESLAEQTLTDFEAILVDDGSGDRSLDIAVAMAAADPRFRVVRQENQGLGPARNTGVREATGEFLTFVDSDDVVPRHAYELMVDTLRQTGSDFAAGDARRFSALGVRESWVHRRPFATRRLATHVSEFPELALDRMAWNKVFRRSFWDEHGLEFPPILYEDYPVTLKAHVRATKVDVHSTAVYYWRERDGGDLSITQRHWEVSNLADRVRSAELTLDVVEEEAPYLREKVQDHLLEIDVSTLARAFQDNAPEDRPALHDLAKRICERIDPEVLSAAEPFARVQYHLLAAGKVEPLKRLVDHRSVHGTWAPLVRVRRWRRDRWYVDLPFRRDSRVGVPASAYEVQPEDLDLVTQIVDVEWVDGLLELEVHAAIRDLPMDESAAYEVWWESEEGRVVPARFTRAPHLRPRVGEDQSRLHITVNPLDLTDERAVGPGFWKLGIQVSAHGLVRRGSVGSNTSGRGRWAAQELLPKNIWAMPRQGTDGSYGVSFRRSGAWLYDAFSNGDTLELTGAFRSPGEPPEFEVEVGNRDGSRVPAKVELTGRDGHYHQFTARLPLTPLIRAGAGTHTVDERASWSPRLRRGGRDQALGVHPDFVGTTCTFGGRTVIATRNAQGVAVLMESGLHARLHAARWTGPTVLSLHGVCDAGLAPGRGLVLRRFVTAGVPVEVPLDARWEEGVFWCDVDIATLVAAAAPHEEQATEGQSRTPWHLVQLADEGDLPVLVVRDLASRLARPRPAAGHPVRFRFGVGDEVNLVVE